MENGGGVSFELPRACKVIDRALLFLPPGPPLALLDYENILRTNYFLSFMYIIRATP